MKKKIIIISIVLIILIGLIICKLLLSNTSDIKTMDDLIEYNLSDKWVLDNTMYRDDDNKTAIEKAYIKKNDEGYFSVSMFSYKGYDALTSKPYRISYKEYVNSMTKRKNIKINGKVFVTGMTGMDDFDNVNCAAYVKNGNYVFQFRMSNFDDFVTKEQKNEFIEILKTVKFKGQKK